MEETNNYPQEINYQTPIEEDTSELTLHRGPRTKTYTLKKGMLHKVKQSKKSSAKKELINPNRSLEVRNLPIFQNTSHSVTSTPQPAPPTSGTSGMNQDDKLKTLQSSYSKELISIPTNNYFDPLSQLNVDTVENMETNYVFSHDPCGNDESQKEVLDATPKVTTARFPPIIVPILPKCPNYFQYQRDLEKELGFPIRIIYNQSQGTKFHVSSEEAFNKLKNLFQDKHIGFYTFTPKSHKPLQVVIKKLPVQVTAQQIQEELLMLDFPVIGVRQLTTTRQTTGIVENFNLPVWVVSLKNNEVGRTVYDLKYICHQSILIETYNPKSKTYQCYNCQLYGHTSSGCCLPTKCVKCGNNHRLEDCPVKGPSVAPTCANCGESHTANYRQCNIALQHRNVLQQKQDLKEQRLRNRGIGYTFNQHDFPSLPKVTPNPAWTKTNSNTETTTNTLMGDIKELYTFLQSIGFTKIINQIKQTTLKLQQASDTFSKLFIIFEAITTILTPETNVP